MKQTAVEWLVEQLSGHDLLNTRTGNSMRNLNNMMKIEELIEQAKEMEKEQIKELKAEIKTLKQVKNLNIPAIIESVCLCTTPIGSTAPDKCGKCGKKIGWQTVLSMIQNNL